jgi:hypothetical protein
MAERVALPTFGIQDLLSTRPPTYKNVPRTQGYRKVPPDISIPINMVDQAQDQIDRILDRVQSLDDLSVDDIIELRSLSVSSLLFSTSSRSLPRNIMTGLIKLVTISAAWNTMHRMHVLS